MHQQLDRVPLGRTGLTVTRLGLGTAPLASIYWGNEEDRAVATGSRAVERGIRLFDSAPLYGLGESEIRLGRALTSIERDDVVVATKVGRSLLPAPDTAEGVEAVFDFSHDATLRSIESSIERLGLDRLDIVHIHDPEEHLAEAIDGTYATLDQLRAEGVVRAVSLGTNFVETARFFLTNADLDCVMVAGRLTLLDRSAVGPRPRMSTRRRCISRRGRVQQWRARRSPAGRLVRLRAGGRRGARARSRTSRHLRVPRCAAAHRRAAVPADGRRRDRRDRWHELPHRGRRERRRIAVPRFARTLDDLVARSP